MDAQEEHGRQEQRDPGHSHHDTPQSSRQSVRGQRPNQGRNQGNRASGGAPRSGPNEGGGNRNQKRAGGSGSQQDSREGRRRRKEGGDRRGIYGFGDEIERCTCLSYHQALPDVWPVHPRSNLATLRMVEVDRRPSAILFCDGAHSGLHSWPDGEIVAAPQAGPAPEPDAPSAAESDEDAVEPKP